MGKSEFWPEHVALEITSDVLLSSHQCGRSFEEIQDCSRDKGGDQDKWGGPEKGVEAGHGRKEEKLRFAEQSMVRSETRKPKADFGVLI